VERSPVLSRHFRKLSNTIVYPATDSVFRVIAADANTQDGLNVHGYIVDEVHRHKSRDLVDILDYGTAAREQPLGLLITTAGDDDDTSIYAETHDYCVKVAQGVIRDPSFHGVIFAAEPDDDWRDEAVWGRANPGLDVTVSREYLRQKAAEAEASPAKLNSFLRFHLNVRAKRVARFLHLEDWDESAGLVEEAKLAGRRCFGGLDIGRTSDVAAWILDFPDGERHQVVWRFFIPEASLPDLDERTGGSASGWVRDGQLVVTSGNVVDYDKLKATILADCDRYDVESVAFNRRGARQLAQELQDREQLQLVEMAPGVTLAPATQELERLVRSRLYVHGGHPVARWMVDSLTTKQDTEGNSWPDKGNSRDTITGPVAAVMALDRAMRAPVPRRYGVAGF
jgi:phage terminase large subunit-like protein